MSAARLAILGSCMVVLLAGCKSNRNVSGENDALREKVLELEGKVTTLERRNAELTAELRDASTVSGSLPEDIRAAVPHPVEIAFGRLSHARDTASGGVPDRLLIYLEPRDGLGRFTQLVGRLSITAAVLPPDQDAVTLGRLSLDPLQLRESYRSGITGTHYTVELPITVPPTMKDKDATVRVVFTDGLTGGTCAAEGTVRLGGP